MVTKRFLILGGLGLLPALLVWQLLPGRAGLTAGLLTLGIYDLGLLIATIIDWRLTENPEEWRVERQLPERLVIGAERRVDIVLVLTVKRSIRLVIRDEYPPQLEYRGEREMVARALPSRGRRQKAVVSYRLYADRRGEYDFGDIVIRWDSPGGLLVKQSRFPAASLCQVYPAVNRVRRQIVASREMRTQQRGERLSNFRGHGREFETATARRGKLTTRQYQVERNQSIILMLDAGRLMTSRQDRLTKLDHAINAAITIASVAVDNGDLVGLLVFERSVLGYLPPRRGSLQLTSILESLCNVEPSMIESAYSRAFEYLQQQCRKRSLVIILTDVVDRDSSADLLACAVRLLPRHLPLIVAISDQDLRSLVGRAPGNIEDVYRQSVAEEMLRLREEALAHIVEQGGLALDLQSNSLATHIVQQYLEVKARGLL
ncbi:MAG: DUF58 domain-containing protein [Acidobacteria bacterium]|nr:DUF58 domain-containing protein [Acidobacteriota bacterium]